MFFWFDALLCFKFPSLARWTVALSVEGRHAVALESVRFRWRRSAGIWIRRIRRYDLTSAQGVSISLDYRVLPVRGEPAPEQRGDLL